MIRFILAAIAILLFFVFCLILWPVEYLVGKISPEAKDISMLRIVQGFIKILLFISGTKAQFVGEEKIPKDRPVLYVANHRGMFDILLLLSRFPTMTGFISKKEWEKVPLLSWWIRALHGLFLDRTDMKAGLKTILTAIDEVNEGISIAIFPEGTRNRDQEDQTSLLPFHEGSFKIAKRTKCPVVPVAISHTSMILEDHFPKIRSTHVIVEYLDPVETEGLSRDEEKVLGSTVQELIHQALVEHEEDPWLNTPARG